PGLEGQGADEGVLGVEVAGVVEEGLALGHVGGVGVGFLGFGRCEVREDGARGLQGAEDFGIKLAGVGGDEIGHALGVVLAGGVLVLLVVLVALGCGGVAGLAVGAGEEVFGAGEGLADALELELPPGLGLLGRGVRRAGGVGVGLQHAGAAVGFRALLGVLVEG